MQLKTIEATKDNWPHTFLAAPFSSSIILFSNNKILWPKPIYTLICMELPDNILMVLNAKPQPLPSGFQFMGVKSALKELLQMVNFDNYQLPSLPDDVG